MCPIKCRTVQCVKLNTHQRCHVNGLRPSTFNRLAESFSETGNEQSGQTRSIIAKSLLGHELGQSNNIGREAWHSCCCYSLSLHSPVISLIHTKVR